MKAEVYSRQCFLATLQSKEAEVWSQKCLAPGDKFLEGLLSFYGVIVAVITRWLADNYKETMASSLRDVAT